HIAELCFTLGIRKDATITRVSRALDLAVVGAGLLSLQGWTVLQPDITMTVEQAKTLPIQVFRPNIKQWALLEETKAISNTRKHYLLRIQHSPDSTYKVYHPHSRQPPDVSRPVLLDG